MTAEFGFSEFCLQQQENLQLPGRQKVVAIVIAVSMLLVVLELTRRRKLREEYSVLWVLTALGLLALALNYSILVGLTELIGTVLPQNTLVFFGLLFLMLLALQFSVRLSRMTYRIRKLSQKMAMLEAELLDVQKEQQGKSQSSNDDRLPTEAQGVRQ